MKRYKLPSLSDIHSKMIDDGELNWIRTKGIKEGVSIETIFQDFGNYVIALVEMDGVILCSEKILKDWSELAEIKYSK